MGVEEIVQKTIDFDGHPLLITNRSWRFLAEKYGDMGKALQAMGRITPRKDVDGKMVEITVDEDFFDVLTNWLFACMSGANKETKLYDVRDIIDEMSMVKNVALRVAIWEAVANSLPKSAKKEGEEEDPTRAVSP